MVENIVGCKWSLAILGLVRRGRDEAHPAVKLGTRIAARFRE
jgi:hypothetical protein